MLQFAVMPADQTATQDLEISLITPRQAANRSQFTSGIGMSMLPSLAQTQISYQNIHVQNTPPRGTLVNHDFKES